MSDPLSITASVAGLISLAGYLYTQLDTFISNVKDAPSLAQTIRSEINSFRNSLSALQKLLNSPNLQASRAALIPADHVVVSFTDAVLLFSQLESTVLPLTSVTEFDLVGKVQWVRKRTKLNELITRLQWHKLTLVLQLNILQW